MALYANVKVYVENLRALVVEEAYTVIKWQVYKIYHYDFYLSYWCLFVGVIRSGKYFDELVKFVALHQHQYT